MNVRKLHRVGGDVFTARVTVRAQDASFRVTIRVREARTTYNYRARDLETL